MITKNAGVDWPTVLKMLAGGAFVGTGVGAGTSFLNQLGNLKQDAAPEDDDKNTLYLNLPAKPPLTPTPMARSRVKRSNDANSAATFALGGSAAIAGTYAAYNVIRNAYQNSRKKQLQKELDQAHQVYLGDLSNNASLDKSASQFPTLSRGVGAAYLALLLTGVGSGIVANKVLNKQFPDIKPPERLGPKRIVIRTTPSGEDGEDKEASVEVDADGIEALLRYHLADEKRAAVSGLADLVAVVAQGRCQEVEDNISEMDALLDMVKGARFQAADPWKQNLAITWIASDPEISGAVAPLLAAEFADACPGLFKLAMYTEVGVQKALVDLVKSAVCQTRRAVYASVASQVKGANTMFDQFLPEPAENLLLANSIKEMLTADPAKDKPSSSITESPPVKPIVSPAAVEDDQAARFLVEHKKDLESALAKV